MLINDYHYLLYEIETRKDFREMLDTTCERFGEEMSFFEKTEGKGFEGISFNEFRNRVTCLGEALLKIGITQRDKIAVIGKNCRKWAIAYYSIVTSNCIVVPIGKDLTSEEIERIIKRARIRGIFFENRYGKVLRNLEKKYGFLKHLIPFYPDRGFKHDMEQLFKKGGELIQNGSDKYPAVDTSRDDVASIIFTSGTTGNPKGVMLSQKNIISNIVQMRKLIWIDETMRFLSVLPLHHVYECTCGFLCQIHAGTKIAYAQSLKKIAENLAEVSATNINVVPLLLEAFYKRIKKRIKAKIHETLKTRVMFQIGDAVCAITELTVRKNIRKKSFMKYTSGSEGNSICSSPEGQP
jgi:long-chain acyl-CoA synthetase